ncbi:MAG: hypothetical protein WCT07_00135 [Candidatus Paceibacterota bacterium]|jgi:hypothetical protein
MSTDFEDAELSFLTSLQGITFNKYSPLVLSRLLYTKISKKLLKIVKKIEIVKQEPANTAARFNILLSRKCKKSIDIRIMSEEGIDFFCIETNLTPGEIRRFLLRSSNMVNCPMRISSRIEEEPLPDFLRGTTASWIIPNISMSQKN